MKIGRNDPCPCGSGRKYKKCCLGMNEATGRAETPFDPSMVDSNQTAPLPRSVESQRYSKMVRRLMDWVLLDENRPDLERARDQFTSPLIFEKWASAISDEIRNAWFLFGYKTSRGLSFAETFLAKYGHGLSMADREVLSKLASEPFRLVEIQDVRVDVGITIKDVYTNEFFDVRERSATHQLRKWDFLLTRLRVFDDHLELDMGMSINRMTRHVVLDAIEDVLVDLQGEKPDAQHVDVLKDFLPDVIEAVLEGHSLAMTPPKLMTTDGEEVVFCKARYQVSDAAAVREALSIHRSFQVEDNGGFTWLSGRRHKGPMSPGRISLGGIRIEGTTLTLETQSHERLEKGKALLEKLAGDHLRHLADSIEDPIQALANKKVSEQPRESSIPPEVERELAARFLEDHYRKWPDMSLPGLDGMTPRQASRNSKMRKVLIDMLKDMENQSAKSSMPAYDFGQIKKELGIDDG